MIESFARLLFFSSVWNKLLLGDEELYSKKYITYGSYVFQNHNELTNI